MTSTEDAAAQLGPLAAIVYEEGSSFDAFMQNLVLGLREKDYVLAGVIQINQARQTSRHCDMILEDLATGRTVLISEARGEAASGCRLNVAGLLEAGMTIRQSLSQNIDLLLINKFGKMESEGGGLRDVIVEASVLGIPALVGVPQRNKDAWIDFCGGEADVVLPNAEDIQAWVQAVMSKK